MLKESFIKEWGQIVSWQSRSMIEQDLILSRALSELYSNEIIKDSLVFRGGTALNKLYITPPSRYSEDIDFVQKSPEPIGKTLDAIRSTLDPWLGSPKRKLTDRGAKIIYRFFSIDNIPSKLKIEINTTEHFQVMPLEYKAFEVKSSWFTGKSIITTYKLEELMATKLRALYQRRKGRDLFDMWWVINHTEIDLSILISIFEKYNNFNNDIITRALFEKNLLIKAKSKDFRQDISYLLTPETKWNFEIAFDSIMSTIPPLLKGNSWAGF